MRRLNAQELEHLEWLVGIRVPQDQMASFFKNKKGEPMSPASFESLLKRDKAARYALLRGRAKAALKVRNTIYQQAIGEEILDPQTGMPTGQYKRLPSERMLEYWCNTQEGFKREDNLKLSGHVTGAPQGTVVIFNIPSNDRDKGEG